MARWRRSRQGFASMDRLQVWRVSWRLWSEGPRGGEAWARFGADGPRQRWRASNVKIDGPKRSCDDMEWIISFQGRSSQVLTHDDDQKAWWSLVLVWHQYLGIWNGMRKAKVWLVGHFISPVKGCVEKQVELLSTLLGGLHSPNHKPCIYIHLYLVLV